MLLRRALDGPAGLWRACTYSIAPDALGMIARFANGDARTALSTLEMAVLNGESAEGHTVQVSHGDAGAVPVAQIPAVRQKGRGALQPDLRPAQVHAQLRPGRGGVLAGPHAGGRRGPAVCGAAAWCALPARTWAWRTPARWRLAVAAYQACHFIGMPECIGAPDPGGGIPVAGAQVQRALHRLRGRQDGRASTSWPSRCRWSSATPPPG